MPLALAGVTVLISQRFLGEGGFLEVVKGGWVEVRLCGTACSLSDVGPRLAKPHPQREQALRDLLRPRDRNIPGMVTGLGTPVYPGESCIYVPRASQGLLLSLFPPSLPY